MQFGVILLKLLWMLFTKMNHGTKLHRAVDWQTTQDSFLAPRLSYGAGLASPHPLPVPVLPLWLTSPQDIKLVDEGTMSMSSSKIPAQQ